MEKKIDISMITYPKVTIVKKMRDYSKCAYFKKKDAEAKAFLKKAGLPFTEKNK